MVYTKNINIYKKLKIQKQKKKKSNLNLKTYVYSIYNRLSNVNSLFKKGLNEVKAVATGFTGVCRWCRPNPHGDTRARAHPTLSNENKPNHRQYLFTPTDLLNFYSRPPICSTLRRRGRLDQSGVREQKCPRPSYIYILVQRV